MRFMPPKPGQTAPQMPPRGPKVPINKGRPLNATGTPIGKTVGLTKSINTGPGTPPSSANVNPIRPGMTGGPKPLNAQRVTAATPSRPKGGIGMTGGPKPINPAIGAKKGGKVSSKMGAVKTSAKPDGIAKKGKTKGRMV